MKTIILAGGYGTRLSEETIVKPKPMVEIGGKPLLWHIMNIYAFYGYNDFLVAGGYKSEVIKQYFHNFFIHNSSIYFDLYSGSYEILDSNSMNWRVGVIDTGLDVMTGGRILRLKHLVNGGSFMVTYGDGVSDINIHELVRFHKSHGRIATVTAVRPPARFGGLVLENDKVSAFTEKPQTGEGWINGGFFVFEPQIFNYLLNDQTVLEREPLERLASEGQLMAFRHEGYWQPMDTLREKLLLEKLWATGSAPWKVW